MHPTPHRWLPLGLLSIALSLACAGLSTDEPGAEAPPAEGVPAAPAVQPAPRSAADVAGYDYLACWFEETWGHLEAPADAKQSPIETPSGQAWMYRHGPGGIVFDGALSACLANAIEYKTVARDSNEIYRWNTDFWRSTLSIWSGVEVSLSDGPGGMQINPLFATWLQGMVPANDPDQPWNGHTLQVIYDRGFSRHVHLMTAARLSVASASSITPHVDTLMAAGTLDRSLLLPLAEFGPIGARDAQPYNSDGYSDLHSPWQATSFWLRRHHDGSIDALWGAYLLILDRFDPKWRAHLKGSFPAADVSWTLPAIAPLDLGTLAVVEANIGAATLLYIDGEHRSNRDPAAVLVAGEHEVLIHSQIEDRCIQKTYTFPPGNSTVYEPDVWEQGAAVPCPADPSQ